MPPLILLALLLGAVLYLAGALFFLYRYLTRKAAHPGLPRLWYDYRRRFIWLTVLFLACLLAFLVAALWNSPLPAGQWLASLFGSEARLEQTEPLKTVPSPVKRHAIAQVEMTSTTTSSTSTSTSSTTTTTTTTSTSTTTSTTTTTAAPKPARHSGIKGWVVCAASFRDPEVAELYAQELRSKGLQPTVARVDLGAKGIWNRVCVGTFPSLAKARAKAASWEKRRKIVAPFLLPLR